MSALVPSFDALGRGCRRQEESRVGDIPGNVSIANIPQGLRVRRFTRANQGSLRQLKARISRLSANSAWEQTLAFVVNNYNNRMVFMI